MHDYGIIGGGIVGLSAALHLTELAPGARVTVLEKEPEIARHQTGRNSGVIHSGIYYPPGSLKARFAREGRKRLVRFCEQNGIPCRITGKWIAAVNERELPRLEALYLRGLENGLAVAKRGPEEMAEAEPHVRAVAALRVPETGVVDFGEVAATYARLVRERGGNVDTGVRVRQIRTGAGSVELETDRGALRMRRLINCAGLFSDRMARLAGVDPGLAIVPFRGEYFHLRPERSHLVKGLVYPVPDPAFPFLGVHFTRGIDGGVHIGPNAVLSLKREGYGKGDVSPRDVWEILTHPGFWRVAAAHWGEGLKETARSLSRRMFLKDVQAYIPEIRKEDLVPAPSGVRAQAVLRDGRLVDDFHILRGERTIHVLNAPSPAATASLEIGRHVAELAADLPG